MGLCPHVAYLARSCRSLALSSLNKHAEAVAYYKKALELDPENDTYKSNLKIAELKLREAPSPVSLSHRGVAGGHAGAPGKAGDGFLRHRAEQATLSMWTQRDWGHAAGTLYGLCNGHRQGGWGTGCPGVHSDRQACWGLLAGPSLNGVAPPRP